MSEIAKLYSIANSNAFEHEQTQNAAVFRNGQWGQCLDLVKHLCQYSENILLVNAQDGMGKTTLKDTLKNTEDKNFKFLDIQASSILSVNKLMQSIAVGFGISFEDQDAPSASIKNNVWVLLIDDAELLSLELIGALFQLRDSAKGLLHIVLFAKPSLESRILESAWREACETYVHIIELEPLTLSETESLLQHQWRLVGNRINLPFDRTTINQIYSLSGGITSEVLKLAKAQINGEEAVNNKTLFSTFLGVLSPVMLGLTVLFGVVFILITFFLPAELENTALSSDEIQQASVEVSMMDENAAGDTVEMVQNSLSSENLNEPLMQTAAEEAKTSEHVNVHKVVEENNLLMQKNEDAEISVIEQATAAAIVTNQTAPETVMQAAAETLPQATPEVSIAPATVAKEVSEVATAPKNNKTLDLANKVAANEKAILNLAANKFTIQLLGAAQEQRIKDFIATNKLSGKAYYYRTMHNDKPWFILIYGDYASKAEANAAVKTLPESVQSLKPWTRDIASIQKVINKER